MNTSSLRNARVASLFQLSPQVGCLYNKKAPSFNTSQLSLLQHRKASSSSSVRTIKTQISTTSTKQPSSKSSRVNGPQSTLPAPLTVPTREPSQALPKYLFSLGKAYVNFYKTGGKNIYANYKSTKPIQRQIDSKYKGSLSAAVSDSGIDRHDFQLLTRAWFDLKRVPMFALVFAICGEFTPLVVIAVTSIVPYTCRIPKQISKDRNKLESRRKISFRNLTSPLPEVAAAKNEVKIVDSLNRMQLIHISWSLGLSSSAWDWLGGQFPGLPTFILRRKVARRVEYLEMDDALIGRAGGVKEMAEDEVRIAAVERGIDVMTRSAKDINVDLQKWLASRKRGAPVERLLLSRPNVWPVDKTE